jgi:hypothetical protein
MRDLGGQRGCDKVNIERFGGGKFESGGNKVGILDDQEKTSFLGLNFALLTVILLNSVRLFFFFSSLTELCEL